jgi:hypothetical protein
MIKKEQLERIVEHLQELGKVAVSRDIDLKYLQFRLEELGYKTRIIETDRTYLELIKSE